jgi:hypothetical protein
MKRPLPQIRWTSRTNGSPAHFQNWLAEINLRGVAAGDEEAASPASAAHPSDNRDLAHLSSAFDSDPRVGEIRLLSAEFSSQPERPVYVAILKNWEGEGMVTAIFSPFNNPALSTELQLPTRLHPLRTLCLWHHQVLPAELLAQSWRVDSLSEFELRDAWQVFRHAVSDEPLPAALAERVGTKIASSSDPRIAYQRAELALMQPLALAAEGAAAVEAGEEPDPSPLKPFNDVLAWLGLADIFQPSLALAAESVVNRLTPSTEPRSFLIESANCLLRFYPQPQDGIMTVIISDDKFAVTRSFDGYHIAKAGTTTPLATFTEGRLRFHANPEDLQDGLVLLTHDFRSVRTSPIET